MHFVPSRVALWIVASIAACGGDSATDPGATSSASGTAAAGSGGATSGSSTTGSTSSGSGGGTSGPFELGGAVQKGPFVIGSTIAISVVDAKGNPTGKVFMAATTN